MKRIFYSFMIAAVLSMVATTASAHDFEVDGIYYYIKYNYNNGTAGTSVSVTYKGSTYNANNEYSGVVIIPETVTYNGKTYSVTDIGDDAFRDCSGLTSVTIGNSVTSIGYRAFKGCTCLTSVTIPNSVTSIVGSAFSGCSGLTSIKVESGNTKYDSRNNCNAIIGRETNELIAGCKNTVIPNSVTSIGGAAFSGCSGLTSVTIPDGVTSIGSSAFSGCSGLTSVTIPNSVKVIDSNAFNSCSGLTSVTIGNSVVYIGYYAFYDCSSLTSVTIGNSVNDIDKYAFCDCSSLTSVTMGNSVTRIGEHAFYNCSSLTSIDIPNSVTSIGGSAFMNCSSLTSIDIPNSVTIIDSHVFYGCSSLTSIDIPNSVTSIGHSAFSGCCSLTNIFIPNSVTSIGDGPYKNPFSDCCSLTSIQVASDNTKYDSRNDCNAIIESTSNTLITGCQNTFIPNTVTSIGAYAFYKSGLTSIYIPNTVTSIDEGAFRSCSDLTSVIVMWETPIDYAWGVFGDCDATLYVPYGCKDAYLAVYPWSNEFYNIVEMSSDQLISVTGISLDSSSLTFDAYGQTATLTATLTPADAFNKIVRWSSSDANVATVDNNGVVTAVGNGSAVITAKTADGTNLSAQCSISVDIHAASIAMATSSGTPRAMIGYSSEYNLDFTRVTDVKAYIAVGYTDDKKVILTNVKIVPSNTGIVLRTDNPGVVVTVPATVSNVYYANLLLPAVKNVTVLPTKTIGGVDYTNLMVGKDSQTDELGFISFTSPVTRSNNCYLRVPTSFYQSASAARQGGGLGIEFVDSESTDIQSLIQNGAVNDGVYYDLQGRKVTPTKKGLYISNGKKVFIK